MFQEKTINQEILVENKYTSLRMNENNYQKYIIDYDKESNYINKDRDQTHLLKEFLSQNDEANNDTFVDYMLKIFSPIEEKTDESLFEQKNIFTNTVNEEEKPLSELNKNNSIVNNNMEENDNNFILEEIIPFQEEFLCLDTERPKFISKKRKYSLSEEESFIKNQKVQTKETNECTHKNKKGQENKIQLNIENKIKCQYRLDYYKKAFKVHCFKYLTKYLNDLIIKCKLPKEFKNKKIFKPNNESFTANAKEKDNYNFLFMPLKEVFCYVRNEKSDQGISLQKSNKILIEEILNYINMKGDNIPQELENLRKYLNMKVEDYIKIYYDTEEFKKFCKEDKIKFYEKEFIKEKKFAMLEKYGFLRLIKLYENNKNFSHGLKSIHSIMNGINAV